MDQMHYNLLFRWFVGLGIDDPVWVATVFTKNRDRLLNTDIARKFLAAILSEKAVTPLLSDEHFSVDGTLIEAWASMKSFQPKATATSEPPAGEAGSREEGPKTASEGRNAEVDFHGRKRSNETHASFSHPDARPYPQGEGKKAKPCFIGPALLAKRHA